MSTSLKLPACERCRIRKVKCDGKTPKCTACDKSHASCILVDPVSHERYSRQAVFELEEKLKTLEAKRQGEHTFPSKEPPTEQPFIGPASGIGFLKHLFSSVDWVNAQADLLQHLNVRAPLQETTIATHPLPSLEYTQDILNDYFRCPHVLDPFIPRKTAQEIVQRLYNRNGETPEKQDFYRLFMLLAIGSISKFRHKRINEHPYGFFKAAQQYIPLTKLGSRDGIQNILLLARFAGYCHVRCSIWEMSQLCMRQCIELGLHRRAKTAICPYEEQINRLVFWVCYCQDRYSSGILGRPFAISDRDITQPLPIPADDEDILASGKSRLDDIHPIQRSTPCEVSVFIFGVKLRQIDSRLHKAFYSPAAQGKHRHVYQISDAGHAYNEAQLFLTEFDTLLREAPVFQNPGCLFEHADWHKFQVNKDKLVATRGAIGRMSLSGLHPAKDLLHACLQYATAVIDLYDKIYSQQFLTWTRSYFHILFTAGMSIMFSLSILRLNHHKRENTSEVGAGVAALFSCGRILRKFVEEMPDASRFALVFETLRKKCLENQNAPHIGQCGHSKLMAVHCKHKSSDGLPTPTSITTDQPGYEQSRSSSSRQDLLPELSDQPIDPQSLGLQTPEPSYRTHHVQPQQSMLLDPAYTQWNFGEPTQYPFESFGLSAMCASEIAPWQAAVSNDMGQMNAGDGDHFTDDLQAADGIWQQIFSGLSGPEYT